MKQLKIENNLGYFLAKSGEYKSIDNINKEDLLYLVDLALGSDAVELDVYDAGLLQNQAHQVIYKSICTKLQDLVGRQHEFADEHARLFLAESQKYEASS